MKTKDDIEFERELNEALAQMPPSTLKTCPSCGTEHLRPFTDLCGAQECDAWALEGFYRRCDVEWEKALWAAVRE